MNEKLSINKILEISIPAIIVFAVSWGVFTARSSAQEERIKTLELKYENVLELKGDIAVIKNDINYIKVALDKHDN